MSFWYDGTDPKRVNLDQHEESNVIREGSRVQANYMRDLHGTMPSDKSDMAILVTLQKPTKSVRKKAASAHDLTMPLISKHPLYRA